MKLKTSDRINDLLKELSDLSSEDRMNVYHDMRSFTETHGRNNSGIVLNYDIPADKLMIFEDGTIGLSPPQLFMSHSHDDSKIVHNIANKLEKHGFHIWLDEAQLNFGDSLIESIRSAIDQVDLVLAFISKTSIKSSWVRNELEIASTQEINNQSIKVIPIILDSVELPGFLIGKYYADFTTKHKRNSNFSKLVRSISSHYGARQ